ncbi:Cell wall assembly regulator [Lignoscripta atroalba]|nr:Cell wall assembly regulator [Lignoscripta atroalba]
MTSYDRHASHDAPYRTGQHMPLNQSRHAPLTSVATSAMDSRPDLSSPLWDSNGPSSSAPLQNGWPGSPGFVQSPTTPYSPGMRSSLAMQRKPSNENAPLEPMSPGEIQMQSFQEGLPPPPPVSHSWKRIDRWAEDNYEELYDQLSEGCTQNDVNELEHELDCSLPIEVRESLQIHDGQERGGRPTGIIFGCMLLDCEEIVQEWKNWRTVNEEYLTAPAHHQLQAPSRAFGGSSSSISSSQQGTNPLWRQELLDKQDSQPPKAIQKAYAHNGWIPLARDWGGNNIAVDLAPGPAGKWGQIIIFGRDYDCKYVIARSWAAFLAMVADDMGSEKVFVDEETQELKLREFKVTYVEPAYLDILRWRMDQKYGRRGPKRKAANGLGLNTNHQSSANGSPYGSPTEERGRSPHRFPSHGPNSSSPRGTMGKSSPLAKVTEEAQMPLSTHTGDDGNKELFKPTRVATIERSSKLVDAPTPTFPSGELRKGPDGGSEGDRIDGDGDGDHDKENQNQPLMKGLGMDADGADAMKDVDV